MPDRPLLLCPRDAHVDLDHPPERSLRLDLQERGPISGRFRPANVRLAWRDQALFLFADLDDDEPWTSATADHQRLWELGDVFEIFLRDLGEEYYHEFHVTPQGQHLQLSFPLGPRTRPFETYFLYEPIFEFQVALRPGGWQVSALIPWPNDQPLANREALVSLSRYDYGSAGAEPVLSSTSAHEVLNFHRQEDWTRIRFAS